MVSDVESIAREILLLGDGVLKEKGTPRELCAMLDGSVFECILPGQEGFDRVEAQFPVSNVLSCLTADRRAGDRQRQGSP